jgi:hypothetical protein
MSYAKFDDASKKVDQSGNKGYANPYEVMRRSLQAVANRVLGGSNGTQGPLVTAGIAKAGTAGIKITNALTVSINGSQVAVAALDNMQLPNGTQLKNTVAKYLVSVNTDGAGTVSGPGNTVSKADYATVALANTAAKLPDCPDNCCAVGSIQVNAPTLTDILFADSSALDTTGGTAVYADLVHMPYNA